MRFFLPTDAGQQFLRKLIPLFIWDVSTETIFSQPQSVRAKIDLVASKKKITRPSVKNIYKPSSLTLHIVKYPYHVNVLRT